jgi:hypothetical protein
MLRSYVAAGFDPTIFWGLTPRLYLAHMRGASERLEQEQQSRAWAVWHVEALRRSDKLPDFKRFAGGKAGQPTRQTPDVLRAMGGTLARAWNAKTS